MSASLPQLSPERMIRVLHALQRIADASARPSETGRLFRALAEALEGAVHASAATATLDAESGALRLRAGTGAFAAEEGELLPVEASLAGAAFSAGAVRMSADAGADVDAFVIERELGAYVAAPLVADGRTVGVALVARAPGEPPFDAEDLAALELVAGAAAGAVAGSEAHEARRRSRTALGAWRAERQLREQAARLEAALGLGGMLAFEYDPATGRTAWTGDVASLLGFAADGPGAALDGWIARVHPEDRPRLHSALQPEGAEPRRLKLRIADGHQAVRVFDLAVAPGAGTLLCALREADRAVVREVVNEVVKEVEVVREVPVEVIREVEVVREVPVVQEVEVVREVEVVKEVEVVREVEVIREVEVVREVRVPEPQRDTEMMQAFIRAVRHELNGPLSVVTGEAQQLKGEWIVQAEPGLERPVQAIHEAAQRLCDLASRLAAIERDPDALVITGDGGVALRTAEEDGADAEASADARPSDGFGEFGEPAAAPLEAAAY